MDRTMMRRAAAALTATGMLLVGLATFAVPQASALGSSTYNGTDGVLDTSSTITNIPDLPSGSSDNSYGVGAKEDDLCPAVVTGSIPPSKDDLTNMYIGHQKVGGVDYLYLAWRRTNTNGSATEDFELNQSGGPVCANGVNVARTTGDLLVTFDFNQKSNATSVSIRTWSGTAWGPQTDLTPAQVEASTSSDDSFGEMVLDLQAAGIFRAGTCESFANALLKSRASSSSFTSELKDLVFDSHPIHVSNCASIEVIKDAQPDSSQSFSFTAAGGPQANPLTPATFSLVDDGTGTGNSRSYVNVRPGTYTITETPNADWPLDSITCSGGTTNRDGNTESITVVAEDAVVCTYVNKEAPGSLQVTKHVSGGTAPATWSFVAHIACTNPTNTYDLTLTNTNPTKSQGNIPAGSSCTVTEPTHPGVQTVEINPSTAQVIAPNKTTEVTITNVYPPKPGSLQVTKSVTGGAAPTTWSFTAHVACTNPTATYDLVLTNTNPAKSQGNIPAGSSCTVTEPDHGAAQSVTIVPDTAQTIGSDTGTNVTITNDFPAGSLRVTKSVTGGTAPKSWSFGAHVACTNPTAAYDLTLTNVAPAQTVTGIPTGSSCTVTEPDHGTAQSVTIDPATAVTIATNQTTNVTITNTYPPIPGALQVTKSVTGNTAPGTWSFVAHIACTNPTNTYDLTLTNANPTESQGNIPAGSSCTVTEPDHGTAQSVTINPSGAQTIPSNQTSTVTITNTYPTVTPSCVVNCTPVVPTPSVTVVKANDAGGNPFAKTNVAKRAGDSVDFVATITNTSTEPETITSITDSYGNVVNAPECAGLIGTSLGAGSSTSCAFTITGYAPPAGSSLTNTVSVRVTDVNNQTASALDTSTVTTPAAAVLPEVATTTMPPTTVPRTTVAPTTTRPPIAVLPLTGSRSLPFTGTNARLVFLAGLGLILLGLGLVVSFGGKPSARSWQ